MDEILSLTPGQLVMIDNITYMTLEAEDGSIVLQEVSDYQQIVDQTGNTFPTSFSKDEDQNSNLEQSRIPVDLSIASLQLQDINTTIMDTNQCVSTQQTASTLQDALVTNARNQASIFSHDSNAVQTFSDHATVGEQTRFEMDCQIQQKNSMAVPNDANSLPTENLSQTPTIDDNRQEVLAFIKDLQNRGFVLDQPTMNILLNGEVRLTDLQIVYDTGLNEKVEGTANIESKKPTERHSKTFKQCDVRVINIEEDEEFSFLRNCKSSETNNTDSSISPKRQPASNGYLQVYLSFVESFRSDISYDRVLDSEMVMDTNQHVSMQQTENTLQATLVPLAQPVGKFNERVNVAENKRVEIPPHNASGYSSRGRSRGGIKHIVHNSFQKRKYSEDDSDYVFEDPSWNLGSGGNPILSKRGMGRSRRFGRKERYDSDEDYVYDESEDESDISVESLNRAIVERSSYRHNKTADEQTFPNDRVLIQPHSQRAHRGRGRPRKIILPEPYQERHPEPGEVLYASLGDVHTYQIGDFVVLRTDLFQSADFNIYLRKEPNVLVVYNSFREGDKILHKGTKLHVGIVGDIRISYKAVQVEQVTELNKKPIYDIVEAKMPPVNLYGNIDVNEDDPVRVIFVVFIQILCCQNLEKNFMNEIMSGKYEHLYDPLKQLEEIIKHGLIGIKNKIAWNPVFIETMNTSPFYKIYKMNVERSHARYVCNEVNDTGLSANRFIKFFGPHYNYDTLENTVPEQANDRKDAPLDLESVHPTLYLINQSSVEHIVNYHALRHYKKSIFTELGFILEDKRRKDSEKRKSNTDLVVETLSDCNLMNYQLNLFKEMILKADIMLEVTANLDQSL